MRAVIQRVSAASVIIDNEVYAAIEQGLLVLLGVEASDTVEDITWLAQKIAQLRIFEDENGLMNLSAMDKHADFLVVSQFTLFASTKKGNRPSFLRSAKPDVAIPLYHSFITTLEQIAQKKINTGKFGADMRINLTNNGPVTIIIDTANKE